MDLKRTYEVSLWTLQDEFITVLKPLNVENIGQLESKGLQLQTDNGLNQYSCSIPMYLYRGAERVVNPIWYNTTNGNIIANMRKIKVILNKGAVDDDGNSIERVYEFLIVKVEERHEKDQLFCDITCEDLAYNELGKVGYKISLSSDKFLDEYNKWCENPGSDLKPEATLQYWCNQFLTSAPADGEPINPNKWYYAVQMDWSAYGDVFGQRATDKVYEEGYTSAWVLDEDTNALIPQAEEQYREKARLVDAEESNIFNLTQDLAEKFGVFVRYEYSYDDNYHIAGRRVVFYNNYLREQDGYLDITYPYHAASIKREIDGNDITTKMFVRPVDEDSADAGIITIMDVGANKSKEDYIMNFEYMREIGAITAEQYAEIPKYEAKMRAFNEQLVNLSDAIAHETEELNDLKARKTTLENAIALDKERIAEADDVLNNLDAKDLTIDAAITIDENNPRSAYLLQQNANNNTYFITIPDEGVKRETVQIWCKYYYIDPKEEATEQKTKGLTAQIENCSFVEDEFGNLIRVEDLVKPEGYENIVKVYLTYKYCPALKYDNVKTTWISRLAQDQAKLDETTEEINTNEALLEENQDAYDELLEKKRKAIADFEQMMGPALRESYWQPEDYKTTGDNHVDTVGPNASEGESGYTQFFWDEQAFDEEQLGDYKLSVLETPVPYPCILISDDKIDFVAEHYSELSFMFFDFIDEESEETRYSIKNLRHFSLGSQAQLVFVRKDSGVRLAVLLTGAETASAFTIRNMLYPHGVDGGTQFPVLGILDTTIENGQIHYTIHDTMDVQFENVTKGEAYIKAITSLEDLDGLFSAITVVYPRIRVGSTLLKQDETLVIHKQQPDRLLEKYEDYYILTRTEDDTLKTYPYITFKPDIGIKSGTTFKIAFTLSNANTAIYLDAVQVLKENSMPKVTYTIDPSFINRDFHYRLYQQLNRIVNINDVDLKLENVQGYISSLTLDLDVPFNDKIEIKNYRNKFEDLFSNIVAQTEAMKKNAFTVGLAAAAFTSGGILSPTVIQQSINRADLDYAFNQGNLTIDEANGIWATSDDGVVAMRGGGIFTATEKDENDNWKWNTGILPQGINADLITTGQLDTNLIRIYAGDKLRFQMNGDGLYAYKSIFEDHSEYSILNLLYSGEFADESQKTAITNKIESQAGLDLKQYVVHNENGLFLTAEAGSIVTDGEGANKKLKLLENDVSRVEISWDGLKLRNWNGDEVFYADPDTGDLTLEGRIKASSMIIGDDGSNPKTIDQYISGIAEQAVLPASIRLVASPLFFVKHDETYEPTQIEIRAIPQNCTIEGWWIDENENPETRPPTEGEEEEETIKDDVYTLTNPSNWGGNKKRTVTVKTNVSGISDYITFYMLEESDSEPGTSPNYAFLTNENINFATDNSGTIRGVQSFTSDLIAYKGGQEVSIESIAINDNSSSSTITIADGFTIRATWNSDTERWNFTISAAVNSTLGGNDSGSIKISFTEPFAADLYINWAKVKAGASGDPGRGINDVEEWYMATSSTSTPAISDSNWVKNTIPSDYNETNKYLWNYENIIYTNETKSTNPSIIGVYGVVGKDGVSITDVINWYKTSNNLTESLPITDRDWADWSKSITQVSSSAQYLWNFEEIQYSDINTLPTYTNPVCIARYVEDGISPIIYEIQASESAIMKTDEGLRPEQIKLTASCYTGEIKTPISGNNVYYKMWTFTDDWVEPEGYTPINTLYSTDNIGASVSMLQAHLYISHIDDQNNQTVYEEKDYQTIPIVAGGANGDDAYTIILSNEAHIFSTEGPNETSCSIEVYHGTASQYITITNVASPIGLSSVDEDTIWTTKSTKQKIKFTYNPSTVDAVSSGDATITMNIYSSSDSDTPVLSGVERKFSFSTTKNGTDGRSVVKVIDLYYLKTNNEDVPRPTTHPSATTNANQWSTIVPPYITGGEYWRCTETTYTFGDPTFGIPYYDNTLTGAMEKRNIYYEAGEPQGYHQGDLWINTSDQNHYIANVDYSDNQLPDWSSRWVLVNKKITGTKMIVDPDSGIIDIKATNKIEIASGNDLNIVGNGIVDIGGDAGVNIATGGTFTTTSDNFNITQEGNVSIKGRLHATGLVIGEGAVDDFNDAITETNVYKNTISPRLLSDDQREVLQTMYFNSTEGLVVTAHDTNGVLSPYSTATKNDGFYIRYNNTDIAKFTGLVAEVNSLVIGDIVVKKTSKGGWLWTDYTRS